MSKIKNQSFPRWSGPFVGALVGALCSFRAGFRGEISIVLVVAGGAAIGAVAGFLVTLLDYQQQPVQDAGAWHEPSRVSPSGVVGRFLTLAGLLLFWVPMLGFFVNLAARLANRNATDWTRTGSTVGLVAASFVSAVMLLMLIFD